MTKPRREIAVNDLKECYLEKKMSINQIASHFHVLRATVQETMRREGIPVRNSQERHQVAAEKLRKPRSKYKQDRRTLPDKFTVEELRECYIEKHMSQRAIAAHFHCDVQKVRAAMKREGIEVRSTSEALKPSRKKAIAKGQQTLQKRMQEDPTFNPHLKRVKHAFTYEELYELYVVQEKTSIEIGQLFSVSKHLVCLYLKKFGIPTYHGHRPANKTAEQVYQEALKSHYTAYKNGAAARNYAFELTLDQFEALVTQPCYYCNAQPSRKLGTIFFSGVDRRNNDLGYLPGNVHPCCGTCNRSKHIMHEHAFIEWVIRVADNLQSKLYTSDQGGAA